MIRSTPVACSKALMLRPSRPISRPFISSLGRGTAETVVSETISEAERWITCDKISWAFISASSFSLASHCRRRREASSCISVSMAVSSASFASAVDMPETSSSCFNCLSLISLIWALADSVSFSLLSRLCSRCSTASNLRSKVSLFWARRFSCRCKSARISRCSASAVVLTLAASCLASWSTSLASSPASVTILLAFFWAIRNWRLITILRVRKVAIPPNMIPMMKLKKIAKYPITSICTSLSFEPHLYGELSDSNPHPPHSRSIV